MKAINFRKCQNLFNNFEHFERAVGKLVGADSKLNEIVVTLCTSRTGYSRKLNYVDLMFIVGPTCFREYFMANVFLSVFL